MIKLFNYFKIVISLIFIFSSLTFAQPNVDIIIIPKEPNITTFLAGYQKIFIGSFDWEDYNQITITSNDFEIIDEQNTIAINNTFMQFNIIGTTAGQKNYTLTFTAPGKEFSLEKQFTVSSKPQQSAAPHILTDFDFSTTYSTDQNILFECFGSLEFPVECNPIGSYRIDNETWVEFDFSLPIPFSFNGTKKIEVKATNTLELESIITKHLTIDKPSQIVNPKPSGSNSSTTIYQNSFTTNIPKKTIDAPKEQEKSSEETLEETPKIIDQKQINIDFKEDISKNINNNMDETKSLEPNSSITFAMLSFANNIKLPDATGLITMWSPKKEYTWVPIILIIAIIGVTGLIIKETNNLKRSK
jgi:hypothetical protein